MRSLASIIYNPAARTASDKKIARAAEFLKQKGFVVEVLRTDARGHARRLAVDSLRRSPGLIIAAGGDGTINEVVNGIVWTDTPLAVLPMGTTNVLAKELGVPEDLYGAIETAVTSLPRKVSLGVVETISARGSESRFFCLMAGIGLDGKTVHDVSTNLKKVSGKAAYVLSGLRNIAGYSLESLSLKIDGTEYSCFSAIIGKASRYGGNFKVTPDASLFDSSLYVCLFKGRRRRDLLRYAAGVLRGKHLNYDDVLYLKAMEVEVRDSAHIQIDGDYLGYAPARVSTAKDALMLVCGDRR